MPSESDPSSAVPSPAVRLRSRTSAGEARPAALAVSVAAAGHLISRIRADATLAALLARDGFGAGELDYGAVLIAAAEDEFNDCEVALAAFETAVRQRDEGWVHVREEYLEFREVVRLRHPHGPAARRLIGSDGVKSDLPGFVAQATASYQAAQSSPAAAGLANAGFPPGRLRRALERVVQVRELDSFVLEHQRLLQRRADERDVAIAMLNRWVRRLLRQLRHAFDCTARPPIGCARANLRLEPAGRARRRRRSSAPKQRPR